MPAPHHLTTHYTADSSANYTIPRFRSVENFFLICNLITKYGAIHAITSDDGPTYLWIGKNIIV